MRSLLEKLYNSSPDDILWHSPEGELITAAQLALVIESLSSEELQGRRIALAQMPVLELVISLVLLDGIAEVLLLLPDEEDAEICKDRFVEVGVDLVLKAGWIKIPQNTNPISIDAFSSIITKYRNSINVCKTTWFLTTSGTTGTPKLIPHSFASLTRSIKTPYSGINYVWGSLYSLRRFAGLQVFLQSWLSGSSLILNEENVGVPQLLSRFIVSGCNALSATPSMWRKLFMHPLFDQLDLKLITLGGEIVDQGTLDILARRMPEAKITHIYASTEAGVGFSVRDGKAGFPVSYLAEPPSNVSLRIDNDQHLWLKLPSENLHTDNNSDWVDSGDIVKLEGDRVHFLGRANGSINVGGNKVMPEEIENVIKSVPEVAFVQVRARKSNILGNLVEAFVVPLEGIPLDLALRKKITLHCRERLEGFKVPAFVTMASDVTFSASGKVLRVESK